MKILLKKKNNGSSTLTCIRSDGSSTWTQLHPGIEAHDLAHYAIETVMSYSEGFYGLVAMGYDIGDFQLPRDQRPEELVPAKLPLQAHQAEHLVNLLMVNRFNAGNALDIVDSMREICDQKSLPFPEDLTEDIVDQIGVLFESILDQWEQTEAGSTMVLEFDIEG